MGTTGETATRASHEICKVVEARKLVEDARNRSAGAMLLFFSCGSSFKVWASGNSPSKHLGNLPNSAGSRRSNRSSTRRKTLSASKWRSSKSRPALHSAKFPHPSEGFLTTGKSLKMSPHPGRVVRSLGPVTVRHVCSNFVRLTRYISLIFDLEKTSTRHN